MKKQKPYSRLESWISRMKQRPEVKEVLQRMAYSDMVTEMLRRKSPVLYGAVFIPALLSMLMPLCFVIACSPKEPTGWLGLLYILPTVLSIVAGLGVFNLWMPLIQRICEWRLREALPRGLKKPLYLGWKFTALFLLGFGGAAALLTWLLSRLF